MKVPFMPTISYSTSSLFHYLNNIVIENLFENLKTRLVFIVTPLHFSFVSYGKNEEYVGTFKDNMRHGHGTLKLTSGKNSLDTVYVGDWLNDVKSGYGVLDFIIRYVVTQTCVLTIHLEPPSDVQKTLVLTSIYFLRRETEEACYFLFEVHQTSAKES